METLDRETAKQLYNQYLTHRDGIRNRPEMAWVCLICGSVHIIPKPDDPHKLVCRDCGFAFYRYACPACGRTIDGRDPKNPSCGECGLRVCTCGACGCPAHEEHAEKGAAP
jgi:rubrerythrin